jgi:acetyl-CoA C-acetyltransferase
VGRLDDGSRFLANTPDDAKTLDWMMREEMLGRGGSVSATEHNNLFRFD